MTINESLKTRNPKDIAHEMEDAVNCFGFDYEKVSEEIRKENGALFYAICMEWIRKCAENADIPYKQDGRNEYALRICKEFSGSVDWGFFDSHCPADDREIAAAVAERGERFHRTLQQSVTRLIFTYLRSMEMKPMAISAAMMEMDERYGTRWERCPMI